MRIFVVSAYPVLRAGLAGLARGQPGWTVLGEGTPDAIAGQPGIPPTSSGGLDVLLADLDGVRSVEVIERLLGALRPLRGIVALDSGAPSPGRGDRSADSARLVAGVASAARERGLAYGLLRRDASEQEIVAAVGAAGQGLITLDPVFAEVVLAPAEHARVPAAGAAEGEGDPLTARELEVLQLLAQGLPNKLIAHRLRISEHTAKFHVSAILLKLGAASRTEAATTAARRGLLIL